jgi:methyl-accepting chemotaxis protein
MKLSTKLIGGFMVVALITLIVGFLGYRGVSQTDNALMEVAEVRLPSIMGLQILALAQKDIQGRERTLLIPEILNDPKQVEWVSKQFESSWLQAEKGWRIYEPLPQTKEEEIIWNQFKPVWELWKKDHQQVMDLLKQGKREEALLHSTDKGRATFRKSVELLGQLVELNVKITNENSAPALAQADFARIYTIAGMLVGFIVALFLGLFLSRSITRPINRVISGLTEASEQVSSAAGEVSSASQSLAEGSTQQAATVEETSSRMEILFSMTKQNAGNAGQADSLMKQANQVVNKANASMSQLATSMQEISKASEETSKIIKTIDEIAFQTNLLALNAAVEAARAGEAGAGFAVVADEVRNLAMRAADAAKNTAALIEGTVKKVTEGTSLVKTTNDAFKEVADSTAKVGELVGEIAAASTEQAQGIEQVNISITEMDKVTQQNAATAEESAAASEELNAQAEEMKSFVADLSAMVGGNAAVSTGGSRTVKRPKAAGHVRQAPKKLPDIAKRPTKRRALTTQRSKEVNPDDIIFMDEDDFKDF